ncbi:hypothetical protein ACP4OV_014572 [Aristida adscensionis]
MNLVTGAIGNLAPKLLQLLQDEYKLQQGVKKKIKFVSDELESIHGALRKVAAVPPDQLDEQVKIWARQVREASYDMEDVLDTFLVRVERSTEPAGQGRLKHGLKKMGRLFTKAKARRDIANAIDDINKQLQEVAGRRARYDIDEIVARPAATSTVDPRLEAMYKQATEIVGIRKPERELISMLSIPLDEVSREELKMVSVVGVGGLGKTTLAKAVYDKLKPRFDCGAFVPVGRNPDLKKVFRDILIDLDEYRYVNMIALDERQLIDKLRDFLKSKRYFIVIDDVWETKSWDTIKYALVENNTGSRIISTTRKFNVTNGEVYKLPPLSTDNSKRLFYARIFGGEGKCRENEEDEILDKILKKCDGVPLAIITMASLLLSKPMEEWSEVCNSTGFRNKDIKQVDTTTWILSLSYYDLPCHLRTCLLYLSAFPEDHVIEKNSLIWKWVAEDFVRKRPGLGLFEVGEEYFNDLVNRSLVLVVESKHEGIIYGCRVHDMVLDLLRSLSCEENFVTLLFDNGEDASSIRTARRLSQQSRITKHGHLYNNKGVPKLRSFIAYSSHSDMELRSFKLLRVLALEDLDLNGCLVRHLGNLIHLRYLGLRNIDIGELPEEIGDLKLLQTLDLQGNRNVNELPSNVGQLTQLVCLRARSTSVPEGIIKNLTSLEELQVRYICNGNGQYVKELGNLRELRVLWIELVNLDAIMLSDFVQAIGNLHNIQSARLINRAHGIDLDKEMTIDPMVFPRHLQRLFVINVKFSRFPSCLPNLSQLDLSVIAMDEQDLKILGGLPELRYLNLSTDSTVTVANIATDGCFQKLRYCEFRSSMVQFVLKEDSSVSFTIWNGKDNIAFSSRKKDECRVAPVIMPNLEVLSFRVFVASPKACRAICCSIGLEYLTSLPKVEVCSESGEWNHRTTMSHGIIVHPNVPTTIWRHSAYKILADSRDRENGLV